MNLTITRWGADLTEADLLGVETALGLQLPVAYRSFLLKHNGGVPRPPTFSFVNEGEEDEADVLEFLSVGAGEETNLRDTCERLHFFGMPEGLVPIAIVDDESYICLAVAGAQRHAVYFWWMVQEGFERARVDEVAPSFEEFLESLHYGGSGAAWKQVISEGALDGLAAWLGAGNDVNDEDDMTAMTPIEYAATEGRIEEVRVLLARGAQVRYAADYAEQMGHEGIVRLLRSHR